MEEQYTEYTVKIKKNVNIKNEVSQNEIKKRIELNRKEYLEVFKKEYEFERVKKQSFENRAGIILTLITGIFTFLIKDLEVSSNFIKIFKAENLTIISFLEFFDIIAMYTFFAFTSFYLIKIISIRSHDVYDVNCEINYKENYNIILNDLLFNFKEIVNSHRENNEKRANYFKKSLIFLSITFICIFLYSFFKEVK
ncbi:hypothetical protein [Fusobacterium nucleatum]|uniref:hypothetical protein n=1 Tax=Fusobacterium nucleatum TaxID=851 RepID=UPI0030D12AB0